MMGNKNPNLFSCGCFTTLFLSYRLEMYFFSVNLGEPLEFETLLLSPGFEILAVDSYIGFCDGKVHISYRIWCPPNRRKLGCFFFKRIPWLNAVDGSEIRRAPVEVGSLSHFLPWVFIHPRWCRPDFWTINSMTVWQLTTVFFCF